MPRLNLSEDQTRQLVLDHAERLFTEIGYDKTTIADIAQACGFSSSNVHRVLGTKGTINRAIAARKLNDKIQILEDAVAREETAVGRLQIFYETILDINRTNFSEQKRVHHMVAAAIEERWDEVQHFRGSLLTLIRAIIVYGQERGEFLVGDVDAAARAIHMGGMRFCHPLSCVEMEGEPDDVPLTDWLAFAIRGLGGEFSP